MWARAARLKSVRKPKSPQAHHPTYIHPAVSSLTFGKLSGTEVFCRLSNIEEPDKVEQLYEDLVGAYKAAIRNWQNFDLPLFPWQTYGSIGKAILDIIEDFDLRFVNDGFLKSAVDKNPDGRYFFKLYCQCPHNEEWNVVEVRALIDSVRKTGSRALVQLTLSFLNRLNKHCAIPAWYNGGLQYAEEWLEERAYENDVNGDEEFQNEDYEGEMGWIAEGLKDLKSNRTGPAAQLGLKIKESQDLTPEQIMKRLRAIKTEHPVKEAIAAGCALMAQPFSLDDFDGFKDVADQLSDVANVDGLAFENQWLMVWEYKNFLVAEWEEWINGQANESGIHPPVFHYDVSADRKDWNRSALDDAGSWPLRLQHVFFLLQKSHEEPNQS